MTCSDSGGFYVYVSVLSATRHLRFVTMRTESRIYFTASLSSKSKSFPAKPFLGATGTSEAAHELLHDVRLANQTMLDRVR